MPLEAVPAFLGAYLALGGLSIVVIGWGVFGALYHIAGYTHNSVHDYLSGHDKNDPNKSHHPMNRMGEQFEEMARAMAIYLIGSTIVFAFILLRLSPSGFRKEIGFILLIGVISGLGYNLYGKETHLKFVPISIAHSSVFVIPYLAMGGEVNTGFILLTVYMLLWVTYQIAISGELKDLARDESNLLKELGAEVKVKFMPATDGYFKPGRARLVADILKFIGVLIGISAGVYYDTSYGQMAMVLGTSAIVMTLSNELVREGEFDRSRRIRLMSGIEAFMMIMMCIILSPVVGAKVAAALIFGSILWVAILNKYEWGSFTTARV